MSNITNIITLHPNENFTLPPGATVISVSDSTSLESSCADIEPTVLQAWNFNWESFCGVPINQQLKELQFTTVVFDLDEVSSQDYSAIKNKINVKGSNIVKAILCLDNMCNGGYTQVCLNILAPSTLGVPFLLIKDYEGDAYDNYHNLYLKGQKITDPSVPIYYNA